MYDEAVAGVVGGLKTPEFVDIDEARAICGVSRRTIYNWIKQGKLRVARTPGGSVRIRRGDLLVPERV